MKIVITDADTVTKGDLDLSVLSKFGEVVSYPQTDPGELADRLADADAVLCNKTRITREVMNRCKKLAYIGLFATGYNNIDIPAAVERGITVCNAGSYSTAAVAQHVFSFILNHSSKTAAYGNFTENGGWLKSPTFSPFVFDATELSGKTLGIVGYGKIGKAVAKIAHGFEMNVLVYTRTPGNDKSVEYTDFNSLLSRSDYITVHVPLTEATADMFNASAFEKMKTGTYFVNTSRGGTVDEEALRRALDSEKLSGAGLDVLKTEPMSESCPLRGAKNLTITPHVAWAPLVTRVRLLDIVCKNLEMYISGTPQNVIKT